MVLDEREVQVGSTQEGTSPMKGGVKVKNTQGIATYSEEVLERFSPNRVREEQEG
jgi:hypothetical protein